MLYSYQKKDYFAKFALPIQGRMNIDFIRKQFPILSSKVYGKQLVYFDNAATSQRPKSVIDKWNSSVSSLNSNMHRAVHWLANEATEDYESTRDAIRDFINAGSREEVVFTSGTTASINLVAFSFGEAFIHEGDEIIVSEAEHHSNIVPWQMLCARKGAVLKVLPVDENGCLKLESLPTLITPRTKLLAITHVSNVLGLVNPIKEIVKIAHSKGVYVLIDGAQGIVHQAVDVRSLDCDFYAFSGHKMYAASGTGVLYGKKDLLEEMPPYMGGGEMIETVKFSGTTYAPLPGKFEAGTQNINSTPTLKPAIEFIKECRTLEKYCSDLSEWIYNQLISIPGLHIYGIPRGTIKKIPLFSFTVEGVHHEDLALILDKMGIATRSGQMCAEPLMDRFGVSGMLRVSLAAYNTMEEAEYFIKCLYNAISMLS